MKLFLRVWVLEREILAVHCTNEEPVIRIEPADLDDDAQDDGQVQSYGLVDGFEDQSLAWSSADPEDDSHLILHPVIEDNPDS